MKTAELALALSSTGMQVCLVLVLLFRGIVKKFPIFFIYTSFTVISAFFQFASRNNFSLYFAFYWANEVLYNLLGFLALQEIFRFVFRNFYGMRWFRLIFPSIGILMVAIAALRTALYPSPDTDWRATLIVSLEITIKVLQIGIFCVFVLLMRFFRMPGRQYAFGIALGFGIEAAGSLGVFLLRSEFGTKFDPVVRITPAIAYIIAVAVWVATFIRKEPSQPAQSWDAELTPEQMITELKRHTKAVKGILGR